MGLATSGIFSGINVDDVVSKLMQIEGQPLTKLQRKEADYQAKISSIGSLLSSLSGFKSAIEVFKDSSFISVKATSSNTDVFSATADSSASPGTYNILVNNIASTQSIYSTTFAAETDEVADLSTYATQKIQIQVGSSDAVTITVDSSNNSLSGIRDAINGADAGVTASIINDGSGYRLMLTSKETGASNRIVVKVDEDNNGTFEEAAETDNTGLSRLAFNATYDASGNVTGGTANMTQSQIAVDASLVVNGLTVTKSSNTIDDVITGVTLNLIKDSEGSTVKLDVATNQESISSKIKAFVSAYNSVMSSIKSLRGSSESKGILKGDSTLSSVYSTLRNITSDQYEGLALAELGISIDSKGTMSFDSSKFHEMLESDQDSVINALNAMESKMEPILDDYIDTVIPDKQDSYKSMIKILTKRQEDMQLRLSKKEKLLRGKFDNLDQQLAQLQGRQTYLSQLQTQLNNIGGRR